MDLESLDAELEIITDLAQRILDAVTEASAAINEGKQPTTQAR